MPSLYIDILEAVGSKCSRSSSSSEEEKTKVPFLDPFKDRSPALGTKHLELVWFVPKTGLQY